MSDTASIVQASLAAAEQSAPPETAVSEPETSTSEGDVTSAVESSETPPAAPEVAPPADAGDDDELKSIEAELVAKTPTLRGNISVSRHQAVLTRARRQAAKELADAQARFSHYETPEWQERIRAIQLAEANPKTFFEQVLLNTPEYRSLIEAHRVAAAQGAAPAAASPQPGGEKPQPDYLMPDGTLAYSPEAQQRLIEWHLAQSAEQQKREVSKAREELLREFSPVLSEYRGRELFADATKRMSTVLDNARARWAGFKEHEADIREVLRRDSEQAKLEGRPPVMTLEQAYDAVVPAKLALQSAKRESDLRAQLIKEMNEKAAATRAVPPGGAPAASASVSGTRTTEDIVREAMRRAAS